jgi:hypothetical protein
MCFIFICENRIMNPVEIILRRGEGEWGGTMEGVSLIKICPKHICNYHNVSPYTTIVC